MLDPYRLMYKANHGVCPVPGWKFDKHYRMVPIESQVVPIQGGMIGGMAKNSFMNPKKIDDEILEDKEIIDGILDIRQQENDTNQEINLEDAWAYYFDNYTPDEDMLRYFIKQKKDLENIKSDKYDRAVKGVYDFGDDVDKIDKKKEDDKYDKYLEGLIKKVKEYVEELSPLTLYDTDSKEDIERGKKEIEESFEPPKDKKDYINPQYISNEKKAEENIKNNIIEIWNNRNLSDIDLKNKPAYKKLKEFYNENEINELIKDIVGKNNINDLEDTINDVIKINTKFERGNVSEDVITDNPGTLSIIDNDDSQLYNTKDDNLKIYFSKKIKNIFEPSYFGLTKEEFKDKVLTFLPVDGVKKNTIWENKSFSKSIYDKQLMSQPKIEGNTTGIKFENSNNEKYKIISKFEMKKYNGIEKIKNIKITIEKKGTNDKDFQVIESEIPLLKKNKNGYNYIWFFDNKNGLAFYNPLLPGNLKINPLPIPLPHSYSKINKILNDRNENKSSKDWRDYSLKNKTKK